MLIFRGTDWHKGLSPEEMQKVASQWMAWFKQLTEQGKAIAGNPLEREGKLVSGKSNPFGIGVSEKIDRQNGSNVMRKMIGSVNVMQSNSAGGQHPVRLQKNTAQHLSRDVFEHRVRNLDVDALIGKVTVCRVGGRSIFDLCMPQ